MGRLEIIIREVDNKETLLTRMHLKMRVIARECTILLGLVKTGKYSSLSAATLK